MDEYTINDVVLKESLARPVLIDYQNGIIRAGQDRGFHSGAFKNSKADIIVATVSDKMIYTSKVDRENNFYNSFVGIGNKRNSAMVVRPVDFVTLSARIVSAGKKNNSPVKATTTDLNKQFGSKRIKRHIEQKQRFRVDAEDAKEHLEKMIDDVIINHDELVTPVYNENDSSYKPPINRNAASVEDVYDLNSLVPGEILKSLKANAKTAYKNDDYKFNSEYVKKLFRTHQSSGLSKKDKKFRILIYVDYLVKFLLVPSRNINKRLVICDSPTVHEYIMSNFTIPGKSGPLRPLSVRDKLICTVLVLLVLAGSYQINLAELTGDLKMGVKKLQEMARILAFSNLGKNICVLKLPLPAVVTSKFSTKRKRK